MFDWVQVQALAGPLKDSHRGVHKPFKHCLSRVLWVIVLLENEPLMDSLRFWALRNQVPAAEKHHASLLFKFIILNDLIFCSLILFIFAVVQDISKSDDSEGL